MIRPIRRLSGLDAAAAGIVGAGVVAVLSQPLGRRAYRGTIGKMIVTLQTLTPHLALITMVIATTAAARRRPVLAITSAAVAVGGSTLTAPLVVRRSRGPGIDAPAFTIATTNLLFTNTGTEAIADDLLGREIDLIAFTEYTAEHQEVLLRHELTDRYPYRVDREGPRALGVAVWSRVPLELQPHAATVNHSIDVRVSAADRPFRLLALHTPTPFDDLYGWADDLDLVGGLAASCAEPLVLIGDINATCWHPAVRSILGQGHRDALVAIGRPFAASWPVGSILPPFTQLDHTLVAPGLEVTGAENFPIPGSDHRGLIVTVVPAR